MKIRLKSSRVKIRQSTNIDQNGVLTMIKVVPKFGRPYYMVPADGAAHFETLEHKRRLHPQWTILEF